MKPGRPRYEAIAEYLRGLVAEAKPDDRLPSDTELARQFGVSRMTARQAVQVLESEGHLRREQGRGTFVAGRQVQRVLGTPLSFSASMRAKGIATSSELLEAVQVTPTPEDVVALGVGAEEKLWALTRLRLAAGIPMAIERAVLAPTVGDVVHTLGAGSLHDRFEELGRAPTWARSRVSARLATARERRLLDLPTNGVVINENRIIYDQDDRPLEHTDTWYAAARYSFTTVMTAEVPE